MASQNKPRMTKDIVPDDFTLGLALVDAIPVIFFGINCALIGAKFGSALFVLGAVLCLLGGAGKVLWKIIVVLKKKNVWPLFIQMRIVMPIGFLIMVLAVIVNHSSLHPGSVLAAVTAFPAVLFFLLGILGMVLMGVFAVKLNNSDLRANWIEQLTNGISQICFFLALLLL